MPKSQSRTPVFLICFENQCYMCTEFKDSNSLTRLGIKNNYPSAFLLSSLDSSRQSHLTLLAGYFDIYLTTSKCHVYVITSWSFSFRHFIHFPVIKMRRVLSFIPYPDSHLLIVPIQSNLSSGYINIQCSCFVCKQHLRLSHVKYYSCFSFAAWYLIFLGINN